MKTTHHSADPEDGRLPSEQQMLYLKVKNKIIQARPRQQHCDRPSLVTIWVCSACYQSY